MLTAGDTVVVSSMLRRAVSTAWIALEQRLRTASSEDPMHVTSMLQEMSRNVDTLSIAAAHTVPPLSSVNGERFSVPDFKHCTSARFNTGNKAVTAVGRKRMRDFAAWCCARPEDTIVVVGHSLYFRTMFQMWLPKASDHVAKSKKLRNCGVVGFDFTQGKLANGELHYRIDPQSVSVVYLGFGGK
mmetsp:Transcript_2773/g.8168  ORF Transcript_2773/g.8168 Transcript_2773/m.8168 type:complete len:186 (+) Transcript_2773:2-559(+)